MSSSERDPVTVATFRFLMEAEKARLRLDSEGLTTFLADAQIVNADWFLGNAVGYIKLQVPASQVEEAERVIEQMREERRRRDARTEPDEPDVCLACGAPLPEEASQCAACGWSYVGADDAE